MALVMAHKGFKVIGIDNDKEKCKIIMQKKIPFFEPKSEDLLNATLDKNLKITSSLNSAVSNSDIIFICVGTPNNPDGSVNLSFLKKVSLNIGKALRNMNRYPVIVVKSTAPPGTTNNIVKTEIERVSSKKAGIDFGLATNPEFMREGSAIDDMLFPHLIVIGTNDLETKKKLHELYETMYKDNIPSILSTTIINSELIKYTNNAFLATKISFINTIANICSKTPGADVEIIAKAIGKDPRIGPLFLNAGPGYGGSCFSKDVSGFLNFSKSLGYTPILLESTQLVNQMQPILIVDMVEKKLGNIKNKKISILGIAFKKNTDDIRESASLEIIRHLLKKQAILNVHDPQALDNLRKVFKNKLKYCKDIIDCLFDTVCCLVLTDWDEYKKLKPKDFKAYMKNPFVFDARRIFNPQKMNSIEYLAIGYKAQNY